MVNQPIEYRDFGSPSEVSTTSDGLFVRGIVNTPGKWSQTLRDKNGKQFIERILPGVFTNAIKRAQNIDFLAQHDKEKLLASTQNDSLKLTETPSGLEMEARIAPTDYGKNFHVLINEGLVPAMSFGMRVLKDKWTTENGINKRSITDLALFEVSAVRNPAYLDSAISARSDEVVTDVEVPQIEERDYKTMNLKQAKEQKQALLKQVKELRDVAKAEENRSLTPDEDLQEEILRGDIDLISEQILELEKAQKSMKKDVITVEKTEVRNLELDNEKIAFRQFLQGVEGEELQELRAVTEGAAPGSLAVPTHLFEQIVYKLYEVAPLFSMTRNFTPVNGNLDILREQSLGGPSSTAWVGEMTNLTPTDFSMDKITLQQKRVGTAIEISKQMINDSGIDVVGYATNVLTRRLGMALDRDILNGGGTTDFQGLLSAVSIYDSVITATVAAGITVDNLMDLRNSMHPDYIGGACFVVSRNTFNAIAKLKDGIGHYYLVDNIVDGKVQYKLFGNPVLIADAMPDFNVANARAVLFGNFQEGYATMTKQGLEFQLIQYDTTQALRGSVMLMIDGYMDGKIYNENAFKFLKIAAS